MSVFIRYSIGISLFLFVMYSISVYISDYYKIELFREMKIIYLFHWAVTVFILLFIYTTHTIAPNYTGFSFLASSLFRLIAVIIFFWPLVNNHSYNPKNEVLCFMPPYFVLKAVEAFFTVRLLNIKKKEKNQ